jgi:putative addiction module CopG family antidote
MFGKNGSLDNMATKTMNVSLTPELRITIDRRLRSGLYGNASDVIRAGLRALAREEMAVAYQEWRKIAATLPREPITPKIESRIERRIRSQRQRSVKRPA